MAPLGPLSVLCVVVVTTSAIPTGDGYIPVATSPDICAISATRIAPTSSAIFLNFSQSNILEYAENPVHINLGLCFFANFLA
jgi:hypothetical protein